MKAMNHICINC